MARNHGLVAFAGLLAATFLLRIPVLFDSAVDWDESIYLLVADDVLRGHLPYTATFDHKPAVLYYVFALAELVFGRSTISIRLLGSLCVTSSGFALWSIAKRLGCSSWSGAIVALAFVGLCVANGGLATNSELVMMAFAHVGGALCFASRDAGSPSGPMWKRAAAGFLFALAFGTKFVVVLEVAGMLALYATTLACDSWLGRWKRMVAILPGVALGFCAGTLAWLAPHLVAGDLPRVRQVVLDFNFRYAAVSSGVDAVLGWKSGLRAFLGVAAASVMLSWLGRNRAAPIARRAQCGCLLWIAASIGEVALTGRYHGHYFLVLGAPFALLVGLLADAALDVRPFARMPRAVSTAVLLAIVFLLGPALDYKWPALRFVRNVRDGDLTRDDLPRWVAAEIAGALESDDEVYVFNYEHVIYHLLDRRSPTPYAFSDLLNDPHYPIEALGVDRRAEVARVLAGRPEWVVVNQRPEIYGYPTYGELKESLEARYEVARRRSVPFHPQQEIVIYRLVR